MKLSTKTSSKIIDLIIVIGDFVFSYLMIHFFTTNYTFDTKAATSSIEYTATLLMAATVLLYCLALFINKNNFIAEKFMKPRFSDWFALGFNALLIMAFLIVIADKVLDVGNNLLAAILIFGFLFMSAWIVLHWYFMKKISIKKGAKPSKRRKVFGFFLSYPFVILTTLPATLTYQSFITDPKAATHKDSYSTLLLLSVALTVLTWAASFIPRKMQKCFLGVDIKSRFFFWSLLASYLIKFFFVSFELI